MMGATELKNGVSTSVNTDKGTKNSFYLKQQLNNRSKAQSKDRSSMMKGTPLVPGDAKDAANQQHRKNHSVVINRAEVLRVDNKV